MVQKCPTSVVFWYLQFWNPKLEFKGKKSGYTIIFYLKKSLVIYLSLVYKFFKELEFSVI
jgi:hypothetical protein